MRLDFGQIQDYNSQRGFGFVSRTVWTSEPPREKIFFHIKRIKSKYPELAHKLDAGKFLNVSFWYNTEIAFNRQQVTEFWLTVEDIPSSQLTGLISHIEHLWHNIQVDIPSWLSELTQQLRGEVCLEQLRQERATKILQKRQAEAEKKSREEAIRARRSEQQARTREFFDRNVQAEGKRREEAIQQTIAQTRILQTASIQSKVPHITDEEIQRRYEIQRVCNERGITSCIHFTHVHNLRSILQHGLLGRNILDENKQQLQPKYNDFHRLDGYLQAICLSMSFPNYRMFYRYSSNNRDEWVVLLFNSSLLWELDCAFCKENAAKNTVTQIPLTQRKQASSLQKMFEDYNHIRRLDLDIPDNYPTHPQAEVLVFNRIPTHYINGIDFWTKEAAKLWMSSNADIISMYSQKFFHGSQYFVPRQDWEVWKSTSIF
jgi:cold shock CspA family protein